MFGMFVCVLVTQSCPALPDPTDCSLPGSSVHGILQARILEWVAIPFSRGSSQPRNPAQVSCIAGDSLLSEPPWKKYPMWSISFHREMHHLDESVKNNLNYLLGLKFWSLLPSPLYFNVEESSPFTKVFCAYSEVEF